MNLHHPIPADTFHTACNFLDIPAEHIGQAYLELRPDKHTISLDTLTGWWVGRRHRPQEVNEWPSMSLEDIESDVAFEEALIGGTE